MTGEMSRDEVTRESYPLHFAAADTITGATVEPFDQYQGPYVYYPGRGRFWLISDDGYEAQWYSESSDTMSEAFPGPGVAHKDDTGQWREYGPEAAVAAFRDLIEHGGTVVDRSEDAA